MQKHGAELADCPEFIAAGEFLSGGMRTLLVNNGERLKRLRRYCLYFLLRNIILHLSG